MDNNYNQNNGQFNQTPSDPYGQPGGYQDPYNGSMPPQGGPKGMGIASMVVGICAIVLGCCLWQWFLLLCGVVGLVLGIMSRKKNEDAKGFAIAGIVCSIVALAFFVIVMILRIFVEKNADSIYDMLTEFAQQSALFIK